MPPLGVTRGGIVFAPGFTLFQIYRIVVFSTTPQRYNANTKAGTKMSKNTLTENQAAVLTAIREGLSVHDDEFTAVFDTFAADLADRGSLKDKKTAKVVLNQLTKKRLLAVDAETEQLTLTDAGKYAMTEVLFADEPEKLEEQKQHLASLETPAEEETPAPVEEEEEDLLGTVEKAVTETDSYTVTEWTEDGKEAPVEWTETTFKDGSKTLKRRTKVSGAWRTDYWGWEAGSDKKLFTSAKASKMARAYGTFTTAI
jgi:hypothetical protein